MVVVVGWLLVWKRGSMGWSHQSKIFPSRKSLRKSKHTMWENSSLAYIPQTTGPTVPQCFLGLSQPTQWLKFCSQTKSGLTHWGIMTHYGDIDLGQHWPRLRLVVSRQKSITWTNIDLLSVRSSDIPLRAISQEIPQPSTTKISLKITYQTFYSNLPGPGANE